MTRQGGPGAAARGALGLLLAVGLVLLVARRSDDRWTRTLCPPPTPVRASFTLHPRSRARRSPLTPAPRTPRRYPRRRGVPGALLQARGAHGATKVADQSLASSILHSARQKFQAKKNVARRHAAHRAAAATLDGFHLDKKARAALSGKKAGGGSAPTSSLLTRMPVANSAKGVMAAAAYLESNKKGGKKKRSKAAQLEYDIAHHKLTTRGLVAAVQEVQRHQEKQLDSSLKDQTDDLIIAKINQLRGGKARQTSTQNYVLKNALTKGEQATLSNKNSYTPAAAGAAGQASPAPAAGGGAAARTPGGRGRIQRGNTAILHATAGSKGGNPEGMLSSYDRQLLEGGPESITAQSLDGKGAGAGQPPARQAMLSQVLLLVVVVVEQNTKVISM